MRSVCPSPSRYGTFPNSLQVMCKINTGKAPNILHYLDGLQLFRRPPVLNRVVTLEEHTTPHQVGNYRALPLRTHQRSIDQSALSSASSLAENSAHSYVSMIIRYIVCVRHGCPSRRVNVQNINQSLSWMGSSDRQHAKQTMQMLIMCYDVAYTSFQHFKLKNSPWISVIVRQRTNALEAVHVILVWCIVTQCIGMAGLNTLVPCLEECDT